jgi:hypothetical protein
MTCRKWVCLGAIISLACGYWLADIPVERLSKAAEGLFAAAMSLFAILGVWIAVLDPTRMLDKKPSEAKTERERLAEDLLKPWLGATVVFGLAFVFNFGVHLLLGQESLFFARYVCIVFVNFLFLMNIYVLLGTVLPVVRVRCICRENELRNNYRK